MVETTITRTQIIVVDSVGENSYHDMTFRDKEGKDYKISVKRVQYFKEIILPNTAVQLNYAKAYDKEYIYSAVQVMSALPPPQKATTVPVPGEPPIVTEAKKMGAEVISTEKVSGQEIGMTTKELGDMIRAKQLSVIFGLETAEKLVAWYKKRIQTTTGIT